MYAQECAVVLGNVLENGNETNAVGAMEKNDSMFAGKFQHVLPSQRLGRAHDSLASFQKAVSELEAQHRPSLARKRKEYTLIVVTEAIETHSLASSLSPRSSMAGVDTEACHDDDARPMSPTSKRRILLGHKHRGFGQGMYNSFGGKVDPGEEDSIASSAARELAEETNLQVSTRHMKQCRVGTLRFTFEQEDEASSEDDSKHTDVTSMEMVVHLFRVNVTCSGSVHGTIEEDMLNTIAIDPTTIRGCDEITPQWYNDWYDIPLDNMFADDSIWLTRLLSFKVTTLNGWFHFDRGGQDTNTILHHYLDVQYYDGESARPNNPTRVSHEIDSQCMSSEEQPIEPKESENNTSFSLEQRLFHALHCNDIKSPSIKEFKEGIAICNAVRAFLKKTTVQELRVVIDVAGGHGALAGIFLVFVPSVQRAVVLDPAQVGGDSVLRAWGKAFIDKNNNNDNNRAQVSSRLEYRHECLRTGLPDELTKALQFTTPDRILVIASHACQHLSDEILQIASDHGVHAAVLPCCQKDVSPGSSFKHLGHQLNVPVAHVMDILLAGKALSWYTNFADVRIKLLDSNLTPQNRLIMCRSRYGENCGRAGLVDKAHSRLQVAYRRAHATQQQYSNNVSTRKAREKNAEINGTTRQRIWTPDGRLNSIVTFTAGLGIGAILFAALSRSHRPQS